MLSILVETSFLSNREERLFLVTLVYQNYSAESIVQGLRKYIRANNPKAIRGAHTSYFLVDGRSG